MVFLSFPFSVKYCRPFSIILCFFDSKKGAHRDIVDKSALCPFHVTTEPSSFDEDQKELATKGFDSSNISIQRNCQK